MSTAVKRACDACHRRKVKCDGINPCRNCASAQLTCTYNAIPQKKGPKGSRAKVISELRETQRQTSLSAKVQNRLNGINSPPCSPTLSPTPGLMTGDMAKECIDFFFANMYPVMPILSRRRLEQESMFMDQNLDTYCLLTSMSAFMMFQPGMSMPGLDPILDHMVGANLVSANLLMEEASRVRKGSNYLESPTLNSLCTSYFLFSCNYALEMHDKAWYYLREATTLAHMMGLADDKTYAQFEEDEGPRCRRLYWLLFVTERAYALQRNKPLTLQPTIKLPTLTDDPTDPLAHQLEGYVLLVNLLSPFDDTFLALWNRTRAECSPEYLATLQKQATDMVPPFLHGQDSQHSDLRNNQQWLKTVAWQLSVQNRKCDDQQMPMHYPVDISRDLMSIKSQFTTRTTETLGVPLVAKLLDITCTLIDVLSMRPSPGDIFTVGPREQLQSLLQLLAVLRNGDHHFMPLLLAKVHEILPRLVDPRLQRAPDNAACSIDIFDGFGNAGMAQPPLMPEFKTEPFTPAPMSRLDEMATDSASSTGGPSGADMTSPFPMVSSPAIMSPGIEYPHMGEFNTMPDIISPMGHPQQSAMNQQQAMNHSQQQPQHQHHPPQHQQFHHGISPHSMDQSQALGGQIHNGMHSSVGHSLTQARNITGVGQPQALAQNQGYSHLNQMSGILHHHQQPQRSNSFAMHQPAPVPRTVGDFHAMQRAGSDNVAMNPLGLSSVGPDMDFSALR